MSFCKESRETGEEDSAQRKTPAGTGGSLRRNLENRRLYSSPNPTKLPPYAKPLVQKLRRGEKPANCVWVACGNDAWRRAKNDLNRPDSWALCLPPGEDPANYKWPVAGFDCLIIHTGGLEANELRTLGAELIRSGARRAVVLDTLNVLAKGPAVFKGVPRHE